MFTRSFISHFVRRWSSRRRGRFLLVLMALFITHAAGAATLTPGSISITLDQGASTTVNRVVTLSNNDGSNGNGATRTDIFFLADNTGSMGGVIAGVKASAGEIIAALRGADPRFAGLDAAFGVGAYFGDPKEFYSGTPASKALKAYKLQQAITTSTSAVVDQIGRWVAVGGEDTPEANFFALQQAATEGASTDGVGATDPGYATGQVTGWRDNAKRIILWFGDAPSHTTTVDQAEAISTLKNAGITVIAINGLTSGVGIDKYGQASAIAGATGGVVKNGINSTAAIKQAILDAIGSITGGSTVDLSLSAVGDTAGLNISYSCISPQGCTAVPLGESRTFAMTIQGNTAGTYHFQTVVGGITGLAGNDSVTVTTTPQPPTGNGSCGCPATPAACVAAARTNPSLICGTDDRDVLPARPGIKNNFCTYGGNDLMIGGSLGDCFDTGPGDDGILAGPGNDQIYTGDGNDRVWAGGGDDVIDTGTGNDQVSAGGGDDVVLLGDGDDNARGDSGDDQISGGAGGDHIDGGSGNDAINGGPGKDGLNGDSGDDQIDPGPSDEGDHINGGLGTDNCFGLINVLNCES